MSLQKQTLLPLFVLLFFCMANAFGQGQSSYAKKTAPIPAETVIPWGKPLADGPIKVLLVAPRDCLADASELSKRLDVDCRTVGLWNAEQLGYDPVVHGDLPHAETEEAILVRLEKELRQSLDVVILANFNLNRLPEKILSLLLEKTAMGCGLVISFDRSPPDSPLALLFETLSPLEDLERLWRGVSECAFPGAMEPGQIVHGYSHEKGSILCLDYPGDFPVASCLVQSPTDAYDLEESWRENAWSFVARTVCTAAGRRPSVRIIAIEDGAPSGPDEDEIPPDFFPEFVQAMKDSAVAQPSRPFSLRLNEEADKKYTVELQLRRLESNTRISYEDLSAFPKGAQSHIMEIPAGPGPCLVDLWLKDRRGIVDWFTALIQIPGWPDFYQLELEKQWLMPNDSLDITARMRPYAASYSRKASLYVRATDGFQRVVAQTAVPVQPEGGTVTARLHFADLLSPLIRLEVYALEGDPRTFSETELHSAYREVRYMSVRQRPSFPQLAMGAFLKGVSEHGDLEKLEQLETAGISVVHAPAGEATLIHLSQKGLEFLPELTRLSVDKVLDGKYRMPCLNDPSYRLMMEDDLKTKTLRYWAGSRTRYSVGNGNLLCATEEELCHCGYCLESWHRSLMENYGDLAFLNDEWSTAFSDWEQIGEEAALSDSPSFSAAAHLAFRSFMDRDFSKMHQSLRDTLRAVDTSSLTGARFYKDDHSTKGYHWPSLLSSLDFSIVDYDSLLLEKIASYSTSQSWNGIALYPPKDRESQAGLKQLPWQALARQISMVWLDESISSVDNTLSHSWLNTEGLPSPELQQLAETVTTLQSRLAPLVLVAEKARPLTAVYDNQESRHLSPSMRGYVTTLKDSQRALVDALRKNNHDFTFIDRKGLATLGESAFQTVILPQALVLDDSEVAALTAFVARGGTVVADLLPGVFNEHGKQRDHNPLQTLFGLTEKVEKTEITEALLLVEEAIAGLDRKECGPVEVNSSLQVDRAVALAKAGPAPVWLVSRWEEGDTLLLNHPFRLPAPQLPDEMLLVLDFIGGEKQWQNCPEQIDEKFQGSLFFFQYGSARIYLVLADVDGGKQTLPLTFHKKDVVYLPLEGTRLMQPHRPRQRLEGGESVALVCLPHDPKGLTLLSSEKLAGGQRLTVQIKDEDKKEKFQKRLVLLDLLGPDQRAISCYRQMVVVENGYGESFVPLALNQMPGQYQIRARDLLTGREYTKPVKVISIVDSDSQSR